MPIVNYYLEKFKKEKLKESKSSVVVVVDVISNRVLHDSSGFSFFSKKNSRYIVLQGKNHFSPL